MLSYWIIDLFTNLFIDGRLVPVSLLEMKMTGHGPNPLGTVLRELAFSPTSCT